MGFNPCVVERWIGPPRMRQRRDLFGLIDLVAMKDERPGLLGVQCTSLSGLSAREAKLFAPVAEDEFNVRPNMRQWLACGNRLWLVGWRKLASERNRWVPLVRVVRLGGRGRFVVRDHRKLGVRKGGAG